MTTFSNTSQIKILIVEDDEFMQAILQKFLSKTYEIIIKPTGMDALAFMQSGNLPDLIISDLNTPKLGGLGLIEQVKLSDFFNSVPIIILSGEESSEKRIKCLDTGADDFIVKPFNPAELQSRIRVVLRRSGKLTADL
ncbi:response regulator transcription factor [Mucilaginibacter ximonensis]|uniref:Response regulator transcription factor n=1 Tax=Mucilaginibacter ximonensis TaxID=538021 RepID=A0ABW5YEK2_9SPHI